MKRVLSVLLTLTLLVGVLCVPVSAAGAATLSIADASGDGKLSIGEAVTVTVTVPKADGQICAGFLRIDFDNATLEATDITGPESFGGYGTTISTVEQANANGFYSISIGNGASASWTMPGSFGLVAKFIVKDIAATGSKSGIVSIDNDEYYFEDDDSNEITTGVPVFNTTSLNATVVAAPITSASVTVTPPAKNQPLPTTATTGASTYDAAVKWLDNGSYVTGNALGAKEYTAEITLTPKIGEQFASPTAVTVNTDTPRDITPNAEGKLVLTKTFSTEAKVLSSITVSGTPTVNTYKHGDVFVRNGLTVTANYDDSTTKTVTSDAYVTYASGRNYLSKGETGVTLGYNGKTAPVSGITVSAKQISVVGLTAVSRTYNGTTAVTLTGGTLSGVVGQEEVSLQNVPTSGVAASQDAGTRAVSFTLPGLGGADKNNYTLKQPTGVTVNITPADYTYTPTISTTVTVGTAMPAVNNSAEANGVGTEKVSGKLEWFTDEACTAAASGSFTSVGSKELWWKFTPAAGATNYVTTPQTGKVSYTVTALPVQVFSSGFEGAVTKTYGDAPYTRAAGLSTGSGAISYSSGNPAVAEVNASTGEVTIKTQGTAVITATAEKVPASFAETSASYTLTVNPKTVTPNVSVSGTYTYDGSPKQASVTVTADSQTLVKDTDYTLSYADNINAGNSARVTVTAKGGSNYTWASPVQQSFSIEKAEQTVTGSDFTVVVGSGTVDLDAKFGAEGALSYSITGGNTTGSTLSGSTLTVGAAAGSFSLKIDAAETNNYKQASRTVTVTVSAKQIQTVTPAAASVSAVYGETGRSVSATGSAGGKISYAVTTGADCVDVNADTGALSFKRSGVAVITASAAETSTHAAGSCVITVNVSKADIAVAAKDQRIYVKDAAPDLSAPVKDTHYTVTGLAGSDTVSVALDYRKGGVAATPDTTTGGSYDIVPTVSGVDSDKYNMPTVTNGTLTIREKSSGGGGGSSSGYDIAVFAADNGSVSSARSSAGSGEKIRVTVKPDDDYELSTLTITEKNGKTVELTRNADGSYSFKMPASNVEIRAKFKKASDNPFTDVAKDVYYSDAVLWAVKNGITMGTSGTIFSPDEPCTRAQVVTFLWRAAGSPAATTNDPFTDVASDSYYYKAVLWAVENGITEGTSETDFSPNATCTRAQIVTLLYRFAGSPAIKDKSDFADVAAGSYYENAVSWAADAKITEGTGLNTFSPFDNCTRGQTVTFLYRFFVK